jgi:hypothetical protein
MKLKRILAVILCLSLLPIIHVIVSAAPNEVYTEFSSGNSTNSGDGTEESPYNLFVTALENVADGGTIYIGSGGAFVNDENDGQPLKITKNVTITRAPDLDTRPTLIVRKGGIVLGANVTFQNIVLSYPNANHPVVCANGYTLNMENVSHYSSSTRAIQLVGGSLYSAAGVSLSPTSGDKSQIILSGKDTNFENIYCGSINGSFDKPVDVEISNMSGSNIGNIYASGAAEGYYNSENFLDPDNEPENPTADSALYPVSGAVSIKLNDCGLNKIIDGKTGGANNANLEILTTYYYSSAPSNIGTLTVSKGTFAPTALNSDANVSIAQDGTLDLSKISDCAVNNFYGSGGKLKLKSDGSLTINGECTGTAELAIYEGYAAYDHLYIKTTSGDGEFTFTPYGTQPDMTLNKTDDGWRTSEQSETDTPTLTSFEITNTEISVDKDDINGSNSPEIKVQAEYTDESWYEDIGLIPLEYTVVYNGQTITANSTESLEYEDYYECKIADLNMYFYPADDTISISNFGMDGEIAAGVYEITITAPTTAGDVSQTVTLTVLGDEPTATPTVEPTTEPTATPTVEPTTEPTATPTVEPTATPTTEPTATPTVEPTTEPTTEPTATPTVEPTATATPTVEPTTEPTATPTVEPTVKPTATPTTEPTATPTVEPKLVIEQNIDGIAVKAENCSGGKIIFAMYDTDGTLKKLIIKDFAAEVQIDKQELVGARVKAMLWDGINSMRPLANAAETALDNI